MTRKNTYVPDGKPRDEYGNRHYCHDETAIVVNDNWHCNCPGHYFTTAKAKNSKHGDAAITAKG